MHHEAPHEPQDQIHSEESQPPTEGDRARLGGLAVGSTHSEEGQNITVVSPQEAAVAWREIEKQYRPTQVDLIRRLSKKGLEGFHQVKSAEAPPAGQLKDRPSRFKPATRPSN